MKIGDLCFVYGSLRHGLGNHWLFENGERHEDGIIPQSEGFLMHSLGPFPALQADSEEATDIVVEVYLCDTQERIHSLDRLEGYPKFYDRRMVTLVDGRKGWVYFQHEVRSTAAKVLSGDWSQFLKGGL